LVPVDHREFLLESERAFEVVCLGEHGQSRALLDHEEDGVGFVLPTSANPLRGTTKLNGLERVDLHGVLPSESERTNSPLLSSATVVQSIHSPVAGLKKGWKVVITAPPRDPH
jgi:hypothetical protein